MMWFRANDVESSILNMNDCWSICKFEKGISLYFADHLSCRLEYDNNESRDQDYERLWDFLQKGSNSKEYTWKIPSCC